MSTNARRKYESLHCPRGTSNWIFRRYSKEKRKEFVRTTGLPATDANAAKAYRVGVQMYDDWLGQILPSGRQLLIKDIARAVLASKKSCKGGEHGATFRSADNQINNHIIPGFGHLRPEQLTSLKFEQWESEERTRVRVNTEGKKLPPRKALANTIKYLNEIIIRAHEEGLIKRIPKFRNNDPEAAPPRYLGRQEVRRFLHAAAPTTKLLAFIMWKQGPRPSEVCQYRYSMINFLTEPHGTIHIPGAITKNGKSRTVPLNSRVSRVLRYLRAKTPSDCLFPSPRYPGEAIREYKTGFETAFREAKLRGTVPYNFRDTAITDMLRRGLSSIFIAKYVQNSAEIIEKRYAVSEEGIMRKVAG